MKDSPNPGAEELSLTDIKHRRSASNKRTLDGQSGDQFYRLKFVKDEPEVVRGKSTDVGLIEDSKRIDLKNLEEEQYTHYADFRLEDRSTVTIIQTQSEELRKIYSLGKNSVRIAFPVIITEENS